MVITRNRETATARHATELHMAWRAVVFAGKTGICHSTGSAKTDCPPFGVRGQELQPTLEFTRPEALCRSDYAFRPAAVAINGLVQFLAGRHYSHRQQGSPR